MIGQQSGPVLSLYQTIPRTEVAQMRATIEQQAARIKELEAHCVRLGQGGAERYWEGRWRDADAELAALKAQPRSAVASSLRSALESVVHDGRVPNAVSQECAAVLIEARRLNPSRGVPEESELEKVLCCGDASHDEREEAAHHIRLLAGALGECVQAAGITRPGAALNGPELLMFANDLKEYLLEAARLNPLGECAAVPFNLAEFAKRAAKEMEKHDFHGFEPVVFDVVAALLAQQGKAGAKPMTQAELDEDARDLQARDDQERADRWDFIDDEQGKAVES